MRDAFAKKGLEAHYHFEDISNIQSAMNQVPSSIYWIAISRATVKNYLESSDLIQAQSLGISIVDHRLLKSSILGFIDLSEYDPWTFLVYSTRVSFFQQIYRDWKPYIDSFFCPRTTDFIFSYYATYLCFSEDERWRPGDLSSISHGVYGKKIYDV